MEIIRGRGDIRFVKPENKSFVILKELILWLKGQNYIEIKQSAEEV